MTRLLMTTDAVGGVWTYAIDLCRALAAHGVEIVLATMGPPPNSAQQQKVAQLSNVSLQIGEFALEWMHEPWEDVRRAGDWLLELEQQTRPDLIHLNGYAHAALSWQAPVLVVAHSCVLSWWEAVKREPLPDQWLTYAAAVSRGLRAADFFVAPSLAMLNALRRTYRRLPTTRVIYNGRDASAYHAGRKNHFVLSAGRMWDEAKNVSALTAIASRLPWPLRIAGEAKPDQPPDSNVVPLGQLDEKALAVEMSRAAIYALPARYEPFGLSALEAALSGCALVLGDIESLREIWGNAALFVDPNDSDALLQTLIYLIDRRESRLTLANRAALRARRFAPALMAKEYMEVYQQLLAQKHSPAPVLQATQG